MVLMFTFSHICESSLEFLRENLFLFLTFLFSAGQCMVHQVIFPSFMYLQNNKRVNQISRTSWLEMTYKQLWLDYEIDDTVGLPMHHCSYNALNRVIFETPLRT